MILTTSTCTWKKKSSYMFVFIQSGSHETRIIYHLRIWCRKWVVISIYLYFFAERLVTCTSVTLYIRHVVFDSHTYVSRKKPTNIRMSLTIRRSGT